VAVNNERLRLEVPPAAPSVGHHGRMPVKPRSLVLDMFGEYLRYLGPDVRLTQVTNLLSEFDVTPATVRVTMSRLRNEGWFTSRREGRETVYTLTQTMLDVLDEGRQRIFAPPAREWSGEWTMVIYQMSEAERVERNQLRKTLSWHGFGPLTTSTWLAPGDRLREVRAFIDDALHEQVDILRCTSEGVEHDRDMAARCWDLDTLAADYRTFVTAHQGLAGSASRLTGAEALIARTELIATFRHFPFRDPRLPLEIRPTPWPGDEAHASFRRTHHELGAAARAHVAVLVGQEVPDAESDDPAA
jgi:phenylacetic acid degradation operon negative regulatory protein